MVEPIYRSALAGLADTYSRESAAEIANGIREPDRQSVITLRGSEAEIENALAAAGLDKPAMLRRVRSQPNRVLRLGPDEWMIIGPSSDSRSMRKGLEGELTGKHYSLVNMSERIASVELLGPKSPLVLAAACPLDLHPTVSPEGFASRTVFGKAEIVLERGADLESFTIHTNRSFAPYVWQLFLEAGLEYGLSPM